MHLQLRPHPKLNPAQERLIRDELFNGKGLASALAKGNGHERVYIVEPTGKFENDPNVTDKKFPGNPTRSYRPLTPLKIVTEVTGWVKQMPKERQNLCGLATPASLLGREGRDDSGDETWDFSTIYPENIC